MLRNLMSGLCFISRRSWFITSILGCLHLITSWWKSAPLIKVDVLQRIVTTISTSSFILHLAVLASLMIILCVESHYFCRATKWHYCIDSEASASVGLAMAGRAGYHTVGKIKKIQVENRGKHWLSPVLSTTETPVIQLSRMFLTSLISLGMEPSALRSTRLSVRNTESSWLQKT